MRWTAPITNRLLLEAGYAYQRGDFRVNYQPENPHDAVSKWDLAGAASKRTSTSSTTTRSGSRKASSRLSYVTGSHSIKAGFENRWANAIQDNPYNGDVAILFTLNNAPYRVVTNGPSLNKMQFNWDGGAYIQDQWRLGRFTFNLGARYDKFNAVHPGAVGARLELRPRASRFARSATRRTGTTGRPGPAWRGTCSATARRRSRRSPAGSWRARRSRAPRSSTRSTAAQDPRAWTDRNGDGKVLNPDGSLQFTEIGAGSANFGSPDTVDKQDPDLKRDKNWTYELTAQHELFPRVQVFGGYYRRHFYDLAWTDNLATANFVEPNNPGDWTPFTYTGPVDQRLQNGGGEAITDLQPGPNKIPAVNQRQGYKTNAPDDFRTYNGVEIGTNIRLPRSAFAMASLTSGKTHTYDCTVDNPNSLRFCDRTTPFRHIFKISGGLPLPWRINVSGELPDLRHAGLGPVPGGAVLRGEPDV